MQIAPTALNNLSMISFLESIVTASWSKLLNTFPSRTGFASTTLLRKSSQELLTISRFVCVAGHNTAKRGKNGVKRLERADQQGSRAAGGVKEGYIGAASNGWIIM